MASDSRFAFTANAAGVRASSIFQPPTSPPTSITSSSQLHQTADDYFSPRSRKRSRPHSQMSDGQDSSWKTATATTTKHNGVDSETTGYVSLPQVNERYQLAGDFDTPGLLAAAALDEGDEESLHHQERYRRRMRDEPEHAREHAQDEPFSGPLARERNGVARVPSSPNGSSENPGWTMLAFGLVGKVFHFGTNMVRGFYAGEGKGYDLPGDSTLNAHPEQTRWVPPRYLQHETCSTPVPGSWRDDDDDYGFAQQPSEPSNPSSAARPPNKRRQTDRDSWVLVGTPGTPPAPHSDHTARRKHLTANGTPRLRASASRASPRRGAVPLSRRQSAYAYPNTSAQSPSHQLHTSINSHPSAPPFDRRASYASTRSPNSRRASLAHSNHPHTPPAGPHPLATSTHTSPGQKPAHSPSASYISPEAERFVRRQARADRAADRAIGSMSRRLEALIAQGQAALGTHVSVESDLMGVDSSSRDWEGVEMGRGGCMEQFDACGGGGGAEDDEGFVDYEDGEEEARW